MTLDDLRALVAGSSQHDWSRVSAPVFLDRPIEVRESTISRIEIESHEAVAVYKPDISITIAWGLPMQSDWFEEPWHQHFPDARAKMFALDFFYYGALVDRHSYVGVDGYRAYLPLPEPMFRDSGQLSQSEVVGYSITRWQYDTFRVMDSLVHASDFDRYVEWAGFEIR